MSPLWSDLLDQVPDILASQDPTTGRFGTDPFIVNDQNVLWPLAVAWATPPTDTRPNPYFHDQQLLDAIVAGGDALITVADDEGRFEFRKKDNSTWGRLHMPWTYSRWIRAWGLVREAMPADRRTAWDAALTLACDQIMANALTVPIRNIPAHHAMGLFRASQVLGRTDWAEAAVDYLHRVADEQDPAGFWSEHHGPVVNYNFVYVDALGCYHAMSDDEYVLPALRRAALFHANLTYPDGTAVETVDERNAYHARPAAVSVGFLADPVGRGYLDWLLELRHAAGERLPADTVASLVAYGNEGPSEPPAVAGPDHRFVLGDDDALVQRAAPWFVTASAYHGPQGPTRWIQDRQAHVSVFHDRTGLVLSGSNTRLQPRWSTFTIGDVALLAQTPGDEDPDFASVPGLDHLPTNARLVTEGAGVDLTYGADVPCTVRVELPGTDPDGEVLVRYELGAATDRPVAAHAAFVPHVGELWQAGAHGGVLDAQPIRLTGTECAGAFSHHGWRIGLPDDAVVEWPVQGHDPYTKDGSAPIESARIVVTLPLGTSPGHTGITITVDQADTAGVDRADECGETVVFFGDSVTDCRHREDADRLGQGYVRLLAEGPLRGRRVVNAGISGNRVVDLQHRLVEDVLAERPDVVSIMIGINDTWRRFDRDDPTSTEDYEAGYRDIVARVLESGARLVLVEPFVLPVTDAQATAWREDLDPRIAVVHRIAEEIGAIVVPADRELNRLAADRGAGVLAGDGVHPTPAGHEAIAALWAATVLGR